MSSFFRKLPFIFISLKFIIFILKTLFSNRFFSRCIASMATFLRKLAFWKKGYNFFLKFIILMSTFFEKRHFQILLPPKACIYVFQKAPLYIPFIQRATFKAFFLIFISFFEGSTLHPCFLTKFLIENMVFKLFSIQKALLYILSPQMFHFNILFRIFSWKCK